MGHNDHSPQATSLCDVVKNFFDIFFNSGEVERLEGFAIVKKIFAKGIRLFVVLMQDLQILIDSATSLDFWYPRHPCLC